MISSASKFLIRLVAAFVAGIAIVVAVGAWRLSSGPISLGFLSPYLTEALSFGGNEAFRVELGDTILTWAGFERGMDIRVIDVRILDSAGEAAARIPQMSLGLNGRALLRGRLEPTTVDIIGPTLRIIRNEDGTFDFGVGQGAGEGGLIVRLARELLRPPSPSQSTRRLARVSIIDAVVEFEDRKNGRRWRVPQADAELLRDQEGIDGELGFELVIGTENVSIQAVARFDYVRQSVQVDVQFSDVIPANLARQDEIFAGMKGLDLPLSGNVSLRVATDGSTSPIEFDVTGGGGIVDLDPFIPGGIDVTGLRARGRIPLTYDAIEFDLLRLDRTASEVEVSGRVGLEDGKPLLELSGTLAGLTVQDIKRFWPPKIGPIAREWFIENAFEGSITEGTFQLSFGAEDFDAPFVRDEAASARFQFTGVRLHYFGELPDLMDGNGSVRMTGGTFDLALRKGRIDDIEITEGAFQMVRDDAAALWTASLEFVASGSTAEKLNVLNREPFKFPDRFDLDPNKVGGASTTRARIRFPMRLGLTPADVEYAAATNLRGTTLEDAFGDFDLSDGTLVLRINGDGLDIEGVVTINGVPAEVAWQEDFTAGPPRLSRIRVAGTFGDEERAALGFSTGTFLTGPAATTIILRSSGGKLVDAEFEVDLTAAELDFGPLLWTKPAGAGAKLGFRLKPTLNQGLLAENLRLDAPGLEARGELELNSDGSIRRLDLSRLAFGLNEVAVSVRPQSPEGLIVAVTGSTIDAGPYLDSFLSSEGVGELPSVRLSLQVQRVILGATRSIYGLSGDIVYQDGGFDSVQLVGTLNKVAPLTVTLDTSPEDTQRLTIASSNAGALARTTGLFNDAEGGTLQIVATIVNTDDGPEIEGRVEVDNIVVTNVPALARVLTLASLTGILEVLNGEGIGFTKADIPFVFKDRVLSVSEARAFGPSLGITMQGTVNQNTDSIDLYGTIVPAYSINEVLGSIPFLGTLLVGRKGEGVFAINYDIKGPVREPLVTVNPLTALAPGFLRNFFSIFRGIDEPAPDPNLQPDTL